jgi:16S rRNA processing protein RimM
VTAPEGRVVIGKIVKPHGLKGEVVVEPLTDFPQRFLEGLRVRVSAGAREAPDLQIAAVRPQRERLLITFEGISDVAAAEALRDAELSVGESEVAPRPPGFVYHWDIEGAEVFDESGRTLGRVTELQEVAGRPLLVLATPRGPREVPFTRPIVVSVDVAAKRVVLDPPAGLLD